MLNTNINLRAARILVFDSGVGGLSVLSEVGKRLPRAEMVFACDNAAFPYGTLSEQRLIQRVIKVITRLLNETRPDIAVIACNSASTLVLDELRKRFDIPFVGVVPAIKPAAALSKSKVIGLLATPGTIERRYTESLISEFAPDCRVIRVGSSEMVYAAEQKLRGLKPDLTALRRLLEPFTQHPELDAIVLACTHFPLLIQELKPMMPSHIQWIDSGEAIARRVETLLANEPHSGPSGEAKTPHRALLTAMDSEYEKLSQQVQAFGLRPFEIVSF